MNSSEIFVKSCLQCPMRSNGGADGPDVCGVLSHQGKDMFKHINDPDSSQIHKSYEMRFDFPTKCPLKQEEFTITYRIQ